MKFRKRFTPNATVDLVPMIDVVFQLVVFFMVSSTFILTPAISLTLPQSSTAQGADMSLLVVSVVSESEVYLNETRYDLAGLGKALAGLGAEEREKSQSVVIEGDEAVPYSLMIEVLDVLRMNGFKGVSLKTRVNQERTQ